MIEEQTCTNAVLHPDFLKSVKLSKSGFENFDKSDSELTPYSLPLEEYLLADALQKRSLYG